MGRTRFANLNEITTMHYNSIISCCQCCSVNKNYQRALRSLLQIVKYFMDARTFQKVKFVYPKNKDSVELMRSYFDEENLPTEFGGKAILEYNHEEFSKQMIQDDIKSANLWGFDNKLQSLGNGHSEPEVAPEPVCLAQPAS